MRIDVLNEVEADEYATRILGEAPRNYDFSARVEATSSNPESAYEDVNRSTAMIIEGISEIGREFDEHRFDLDIVKKEYANELEELQEAYQILSKNGIDFATDISVSKEGETPEEAIRALEDTEITPILVGTEEEYQSAILYNPEETPRFQPRIQPTKTTTPTEAQTREEEIDQILKELNI